VISLDKQKVGFRMREKRNEMKMTQVEFAKKAGISTNYYASIEQGKNSPSLDVLARIAKALDVSVLYLLNDRIDDMENRVAIETKRLKDLFKSIPETQLNVAEGLITQAARLRILLDDNWKDILENGEYEKFSQSENQVPYDRKRPIVENYDNRDKTYQSIIKQLNDLLPQSKPDRKSKLLGR
jgi:transcriptional regulator with XRE-family HTH domain